MFKKVTGLNTKDFEILCSIGVFNSSLMNEAIFKFKRYEDASLSYTGIDKHINDETMGGWDTAIKKKEYELLFYNQQESMKEYINPFNKIIEDINKQKNKKVEHAEKKTEKIYDKTIEEQIEKFDSLKEGDTVYHQRFGAGEVSWIDKKRAHIKVKFGDVNKQFVYPNAFIQGHLSFDKN